MTTSSKMLAKKLLAVHPEKEIKKKRKKTRMTIAKLFALNANAQKKIYILEGIA